MTLSDYLSLSDEEKVTVAYDIYNDSEICDSIKDSFLEHFGDPKISSVDVGSYGIGGGAVIQVTLAAGADRASFPKTYLGFSIVRKYE
jgi:hypothetical protein